MYCSKTQGTVQRHRGGADADGATHRESADRGRAKQRDGTDPNTGQKEQRPNAKAQPHGNVLY